ncbi:MAG: WhiB family transcriptional regulator [Acidimicrobiales bacterium]
MATPTSQVRPPTRCPPGGSPPPPSPGGTEGSQDPGGRGGALAGIGPGAGRCVHPGGAGGRDPDSVAGGSWLKDALVDRLEAPGTTRTGGRRRYAPKSDMDPTVETEWMGRGNCRSSPPSVFFPSDGLGVQEAQKICAQCPVAQACLEYALANHIDHGVWGGCSERERRRILRARRVAKVSVSS